MMIFPRGSKFCMSSWFSVARLVVRPLNSVDITFLSLAVSRHHLTSHPGGPQPPASAPRRICFISWASFRAEIRAPSPWVEVAVVSTLAGLRLSTPLIVGCVLMDACSRCNLYSHTSGKLVAVSADHDGSRVWTVRELLYHPRLLRHNGWG